MLSSPPTFLLTGGGTGGHVIPALAIAGELKKQRPNARILFAGTRRKIEGTLVPAHGYEMTSIWISGFQRKLSMQNLLFPLKVLVSLIQSFFLIRRSRPAAVIGTGGYVCGPVLAVASRLRIPVFIHESNSYPGVTTRLLAPRAAVVFLGSYDAAKWLKPGVRTEVVGTPTSDALDRVSRTEALEYFGIDDTRPVVLITGGSQGSASLNRAVLKALAHIGSSAWLIWQTGPRQFSEIRKALGNNNPGRVSGFIDRMDLAYAAADIVVGRAGATSIAEMTRAGKPSILVPYPSATGDHQTHNARSLVEAGAAVLIRDHEVAERLPGELSHLLQDEDRRRKMATAAKRLARPDAARVVVKRILEFLSL